MPKVSINLNMSQIKEVIEQLKTEKKVALLRDIEKETWSRRFKQFLANIDKRGKRGSIIEEEIRNEVEQVRKTWYEKGNY